jgi:hypothetical protein
MIWSSKLADSRRYTIQFFCAVWSGNSENLEDTDCISVLRWSSELADFRRYLEQFCSGVLSGPITQQILDERQCSHVFRFLLLLLGKFENNYIAIMFVVGLVVKLHAGLFGYDHWGNNVLICACLYLDKY